MNRLIYRADNGPVSLMQWGWPLEDTSRKQIISDTKKLCAEAVETVRFTGNEMHFANEAVKAIMEVGE